MHNYNSVQNSVLHSVLLFTCILHLVYIKRTLAENDIFIKQMNNEKAKTRR